MNSQAPSDNPLSCADVQELLPDFVTGELDAASADALERHAATCESCAKEIAGWKQATGVVKRAAMAQNPTSAQSIYSPHHAFRFPRPLALAASLALAFLLGILTGRFGPFTSASAIASASEPRESLASRYRQAVSASPNANPLGLALLSIARRE